MRLSAQPALWAMQCGPHAQWLADVFQFFDQQGLDHMLFESADHLIEIDLRISQGHIKDINCPIPLGGNLGPVNSDTKIHKYGGNFVEHADMVPGFYPD